MVTPRSPDYIVKALDKSNDQRKGRIGAAWLNEDGSISISLDPFVVIDASLTINLFPKDTPGAKK